MIRIHIPFKMNLIPTTALISLKNVFLLHFTDQLVLPEGAPVTFGSGDDGESYLMESAAPGDLVPGLTDRVPAAHREFARLPVGSAVEVTLKDFDSGVPEKLKATHWGQVCQDFLILPMFIIFFICFNVEF